MKIYRTEPNEYGWRTKFVCIGDKTVKIVHENNHKGYWKESLRGGHRTWCYLDDIKGFLKELKK